nr:hypothetical protein GCM10025699_40020 [Microbacterium flavescens]BFF16345.1 hypothetical protein GCM10025699_76480 [Microbacterium flavescens]
MPEGDSVYLLAARLRPALVGRLVADGELRSGDAAGTRLAGRRITELDTHGKHLLTRFDDGTTLHTHLRLQGSWTLTGAGRALPGVCTRRCGCGPGSTTAGRCGASTSPSWTWCPPKRSAP